MKQRIRLTVGFFHYSAGLALFAAPWLTQRYSPEGLIESVCGAILITSSALSRFELGWFKLLAYKEHLIVALTISGILSAFSLAQLSSGSLQASWLVIGVLSVLATSVALKM